MVKIPLTVSDELNDWIIEKGGSGWGARQRFIVAYLESLRSGLIIVSHGNQIVAVESEESVIDEDDARAQQILKERREKRSKIDPNKFHIVDLGDEWKESFKNELQEAVQKMGLSSDADEMITQMKEERESIRHIIMPPTSSISSPPPPPPPQEPFTAKEFADAMEDTLSISEKDIEEEEL